MAQLLACIAWLAACVLGSYVVMRYDFQPGALGPPPSQWPADTTLKPEAGRVTLLAFLHPRCPCTAATVNQLVGAMRQQPEATLVAVLFVPPESEPEEGWHDTAYEQSIRSGVPGARIVHDPGGREAERFGAATSGTVLVYDRKSREVFRGGITNRRGGEEDNPGLRQLVRALAEEPPEAAATAPVFGCPLQAPGNGREAP
jgi:hypothetical protein